MQELTGILEFPIEQELRVPSRPGREFSIDFALLWEYKVRKV